MAIYIHNIKHEWMPSDDERHIYIGRGNNSYAVKTSPLANPYKIGREYDREAAIAKYRQWLKNAPLAARAELERIRRLAATGDVHLYCWCAPHQCHGDVIKTLTNQTAAAAPSRDANRD